jgi:hypothetical protein
MHRGAVLGLALLAACCPPAAAQAPEANEAAKAFAGVWEFTNADRDKVCTVTFRTDPAASGFALEFDPACAAKFSFVGQITGWSLAENDFLRLLDAGNSSLLEFSEVESGVYEAPMPGEGILFIQKADAAGPAPRTAAELSGEWTIVRGAGKPVCTLTLSDTEVGENFAVRVRPPCDAFVMGFGPVSWRIERGELLLNAAKGNPWRFEEQDAATWRRVPSTADPVILIRK